LAGAFSRFLKYLSLGVADMTQAHHLVLSVQRLDNHIQLRRVRRIRPIHGHFLHLACRRFWRPRDDEKNGCFDARRDDPCDRGALLGRRCGGGCANSASRKHASGDDRPQFQAGPGRHRCQGARASSHSGHDDGERFTQDPGSRSRQADHRCGRKEGRGSERQDSRAGGNDAGSCRNAHDHGDGCAGRVTSSAGGGTSHDTVSSGRYRKGTDAICHRSGRDGKRSRYAGVIGYCAGRYRKCARDTGTIRNHSGRSGRYGRASRSHSCCDAARSGSTGGRSHCRRRPHQAADDGEVH
jgi:hypothetical protein